MPGCTGAADTASDGRLSRLRTQLANRLRQQLGRPVHLLQDVAAIPPIHYLDATGFSTGFRVAGTLLHLYS